MKSLRSLFRIGLGPSSSHTMGPNRAAKIFAERCPNVDTDRVTLYGSLAATGKGHMTDMAIISVLEPLAKLELIWEPETFLPFHPNGMLYEGIKDGKVTDYDIEDALAMTKSIDMDMYKAAYDVSI